LFKPQGFVVSTALLSLLSTDLAEPSFESCLRHDRTERGALWDNWWEVWRECNWI